MYLQHHKKTKIRILAIYPWKSNKTYVNVRVDGTTKTKRSDKENFRYVSENRHCFAMREIQTYCEIYRVSIIRYMTN